MLQCVDSKVKTAHLIQHHHVKRRRCCALIHVAAYMETAFIGAPVNHGVNEPAIIVEGEDDRCVFGEERVKGHVVHPMRMIVRHHQTSQPPVHAPSTCDPLPAQCHPPLPDTRPLHTHQRAPQPL